MKRVGPVWHIEKDDVEFVTLLVAVSDATSSVTIDFRCRVGDCRSGHVVLCGQDELLRHFSETHREGV